jgi:hypothetical protein
MRILINELEKDLGDTWDLRGRERGPAVRSALIRSIIAIVRKSQCPEIERTQATKERDFESKLCRTGKTHNPDANPNIGNPNKYKREDTLYTLKAMKARVARTRSIGI